MVKIFQAAFFFLLLINEVFSQAWSSLGIGVQNSTADYTCVYTMMEFNNELYIGGCFTSVNGVPANYVAKFDGVSWHALGNGLWHTGNSSVIYSGVRTLTVYNGEIYAGGIINQSGTTPLYCVAKWDGNTWSPVGGFYSGADGVLSLTVYNNELYAGGGLHNGMNSIAKWDGTLWTTLGSGIQRSNGTPGLVRDMKTFNNLLYVGGQFATGNAIPSENLICWDGANFISIGTGVIGDYGVTKLGMYDSDMVITGGFTNINGTPFKNIAGYDNVNYFPFGTGTGTAGGYSYETLEVEEYNGKMFAGGTLQIAGSTGVNNIAQWDGNGWLSVGIGTNGCVASLIQYHGELYAAGHFSSAGGLACNNIAKWTESGMGITQEHSLPALNCFPNPFSEQATIEIAAPVSEAEIIIFNSSGQTVKELKDISGHEATLTRENLTSGIYFIALFQKDKLLSERRMVIIE